MVNEIEGLVLGVLKKNFEPDHIQHDKGKTSTIGQVYNGMSQEKKDLFAIVMAAVQENTNISGEDDLVREYENLSHIERAIMELLVGASDDSIEHSDLSDDELAHFGTKGMKWGVRKDRSSGQSRGAKKAQNMVRRASEKDARPSALAKVRSGTGTLDDAHKAALKTKGHRLTNAVLGDKTYWKRAGVILAVGVGATAIATTAGAPVAVGSAIMGAQKVASIANNVNNAHRAITANKRIRESQSKLGSAANSAQTSGSEKIRKTLMKDGGLSSKSVTQKKVRHSDSESRDFLESRDNITSSLSHVDNGQSIVIVALPAEDDLVWEVSSEKKPHMTLMYLGKNGLQNEENAVRFVEHIAKTSMKRFGMSVDRRGTLGEDGADVLFFNKDWVTKNLIECRSHLLTNDDIAEAYNSVEQYPEFTPHLTLGYPETPAKELDDDRKIHWINFDRIAIWFVDSEGPEFDLPSNDLVAEEAFHDSLEPIGKEERMSHMNDKRQARIDASSELKHTRDMARARRKVEEDSNELEHAGVKGMKWGVRKDSGHEGQRTKTKKLAKLDTKFEKEVARANKGIATPKFNNAVVSRINERVRQMNDSPKFRDYDERTSSPTLKKAYEKASIEVFESSFRDAVRDVYGSNPSGNKKGVYNSKEQRVDLVDVEVKHSETEVSPVSFLLKKDERGFIVDFKMVPLVSDKLDHSEFENLLDDVMGDSLEHFGTKGMRWGVRRPVNSNGLVKGSVKDAVEGGQTPRSSAALAKIKGGKKDTGPVHEDHARLQAALKKSVESLSTKELQEVNNRIRSLQDNKKLTAQEKLSNRSTAKKVSDKLLGINQPQQKGNKNGGKNSGSKVEAAILLAQVINEVMKKRSSNNSSTSNSGSSIKELNRGR